MWVRENAACGEDGPVRCRVASRSDERWSGPQEGPAVAMIRERGFERTLRTAVSVLKGT